MTLGATSGRRFPKKLAAGWAQKNLPETCFSMEDYMDVSKNNGTPKWMLKIMEYPTKMDDLGIPVVLETSIYSNWWIHFC